MDYWGLPSSVVGHVLFQACGDFVLSCYVHEDDLHRQVLGREFSTVLGSHPIRHALHSQHHRITLHTNNKKDQE